MQGGDGDDGEAPWHDQTMPIADRMKLAEGRPLRRRMMAAMAQQDCGQCGYNCNDYSDAIADQGGAAAQSLRPRRQGNRPDAEGAERGTGKGAGAPVGRHTRRERARDRRGARPFARQSGAGKIPVAASAQRQRVGKGNLAHRFRSVRLRARLCRRRFLRHFCPQRSRPCRPDHRPARRVPHHGSARQDPARGPARRRLAGAGAGFAVRTDLLPHRRRAARKGPRAGAGRGSRRRCGDARRDGGAAEIFQGASASGSLRRGAGAVAAAALFDLVVAQCDARQTVADGRLRALRDQQAQAPRSRLDLPGGTHSTRRRSESLRAEGARLCAAAGSDDADHHDRPRHRRRAVPRLPAGPQGHRRARQELAVLRPSAQRVAISSMPTSSTR